MNYIVLSLKNSKSNRYNDDLYKVYHFPRVYKKLIKSGDIFIYCLSDTISKQVKYIGSGEIGEISTVDEENYYALLINCKEFDSEVSIKKDATSKEYIEMLGEKNIKKKMPAFQRSIRALNSTAYECIISKSRFNDKFDFLEFIEDYIEQANIESANIYRELDKIEKSNNRLPELIGIKEGKKVFRRDSRLLKTVLDNNKYLCSISSKHKTFQSNGQHQYAEGHHLIPMSFQNNYLKINLDHVNNIFSLCPICHSAIHYGATSEKIYRLKILYESDKFQRYIKRFADLHSFENFIDFFY